MEKSLASVTKEVYLKEIKLNTELKNNQKLALNLKQSKDLEMNLQKKLRRKPFISKNNRNRKTPRKRKNRTKKFSMDPFAKLTSLY